MRKFLLYLSILCMIIINSSFAWETLHLPGNTPKRLLLKEPGQTMIVGTYWTGFFLLNLEDETWYLPEYGPGCCDGGLLTGSIDSPYPGSDTLLATTFEVLGRHTNPAWIMRSEDGGLSWQKSDYGIPQPNSNQSKRVSFDPFHPDTALWVGGNRHVYRSTDCGLNWSEMDPSVRTVPNTFAWSSFNEGLLFLGTVINNDTSGVSGILRSNDFGESYEQVWPQEFPEPGRTMKINDFIEDPFDPAHWMAAVYDYYISSEDYGECLFVSNDTGYTWRLSMEGMDNVFLIEDLLADPTTQGRFWATAPQEGIFRTDDGGLNWVHDDDGLGQYDNYQYLAIDPANNELFVTQYTGLVYRKPSFDSPWQPVAPNPYDSTYPSLSMNNNEIVTINTMGIFTSPPPPDWDIHRLDDNLYEDLGIEDHLYLALDPNNPNRRAIASIVDWRNYKYRIHVTDNDGDTWTEWAENDLLEGCPHFIEFIHPDTLLAIGILDGSFQLVWEDGYEVYNGPGIGYISSFLRNGDYCLFLIDGTVYWSEDRGITRHRASGDQNRNQIYTFNGDLSENGLLVASDYVEGLYYSSDRGHNWSRMDPPCDGDFSSVAIGAGFIYVISYDEEMVFAREGLEGIWFALDESWPEGFIPLQISADEHGIVMSGNVNRPDVQSLFYMHTPQSGVSGSWEALPSNYLLHAPYPNPFNAETTISFTLPEPSHVKILVSNLNGQEVATLTDQDYSFGRHNIHWDASGLASGTYIITLKTTKGNNLARKVQLIK